MSATGATSETQEVIEVLVRYATGIDRRDWDLFRTCFTEDCRADYGDVGVFDGAAALTSFMRASHEEMGHTFHRLTNFTVAIEGDRATARTYVDAVLLVPGSATGVNPIGFYDDELVRDASGWRIRRRAVTIAIYRPIG